MRIAAARRAVVRAAANLLSPLPENPALEENPMIQPSTTIVFGGNAAEATR
jgi:hypothetical protein